uniref:Uncharacterized protein n=1 Tax=Gadus morhua TaxID=8049 RepID=A0A8C4ZVW4_GADMO
MDGESIKKMLRSVLLSSKEGVSIGRLQTEYRSLCGELIPHSKLGHHSLEDFLRSIPSVVRLEHRMGEMRCFAAICKETRHIAEMVARQKSSKKPGRSQLVNCTMRFKPSNPYMLNVKPRSILRQPSLGGSSGWLAARPRPYSGSGRLSASGDYRYHSNSSSPCPVSEAPPQQASLRTYGSSVNWCNNLTNISLSPWLQPEVYNPELVQSRLSDLLSKHCSGLWLSKLPGVYLEMFAQAIPPQALQQLDTWSHICMVRPSSPVKDPASTASASLWSPSRSPGFAPNMPTAVSNAAGSPPNSSAVSPLSPELQDRLLELLSKYSNGLWTHALPQLFLDTYKMAFPEAVLGQLSLLEDICSVDYPLSHDRSKAILYERREAESQRTEPCCSTAPASGVPVLGVQALPSLTLPTEQYPSVLVTEARGSDRVTVRYVGKGYSKAQESMENAMLAFYTQSPTPDTLPSPAIGQLAAVTGEAGDELARVQVIEDMTSEKVKVYYVDYGFSMEVSSSSLLVLPQDFLTLPFQATTVQLAGLEAWSSKPVVVSALERLAVGRILLMETVEVCPGEKLPLVVLYDTSQDDDLNINAACRKALQDHAAQDHAPLIVSSRYQDVWVTNVSSDGFLSCQLPCRGRSSLSGLLAKIEAFFSNQVTSECLVSQPFSGKLCLARHRGKWSRAEIYNLHGGRVMDVVFIDLGVSSSIEVTELREVPPPFLTDLTVLPAQAVRCFLADLDRPSGPWSPEALLWIRQTVLNMPCTMKVLAHHSALGDLSSLVEKLSLNGQSVSAVLPKARPEAGDSPSKPAPLKLPTVCKNHLLMPPLVELPQAGQNMDVFVPVACHPGHFVVQPWQDLYKLVVLMGEMVLYYNQSQTSSSIPLLHKEHVYAAKIDRNWHRVLLKGVLSTGLVSVYELDYGQYELVSSSQLRSLIPEFRQLPFQAVTAQLAGVPHGGWSEEASMVFRNHVEKRALVAQVESVHEGSEVKAGLGEVSERRLTVFLVDTSEEDNDVWIHNIMTDLCELPATSTI